MADRWIISHHDYHEHTSLKAAEAERVRLSEKCPDRTFRIRRVKDTLTAGETAEKIKALTEALEARLEKPTEAFQRLQEARGLLERLTAAWEPQGEVDKWLHREACAFLENNK